MNLGLIDRNHQPVAIIHLDGHDLPLLLDAMPGLLQDPLHFRRDGIGNLVQQVLVDGVRVAPREC